MAIAKGSRGFRVLITTDATVAGNGREIIDFAVTLADKYQHTILVEWAGGGSTVAGCAGIANSTGTAQLLAGAASLEDAIQKYPGSKLDIIPAGAGSGVGDGDTAAMLLDALDEIYEFVIVCGPSHNAALLFEAVQGRFDAGVLVCDGKLKSAEIDKTVKFLGFDVPDFPVFSIIGTGKMGLSTGLTPLESGGRAPNQSPRRSVAATTGQT